VQGEKTRRLHHWDFSGALSLALGIPYRIPMNRAAGSNSGLCCQDGPRGKSSKISRCCIEYSSGRSS